ncbi:MAG: hypothetical protein L0H37_11325, partial [Nitrosospira sp.]|nr:hypothetical protein [Nitrosospira sp.]
MSKTNTKSRLLFALSPLALIALCAAIQFIAGRYIGVWAWVPTLLGFWLIIALLLYKYPGSSRPRQRFRRPSGSPFWSAL